MAKAKAKGQSGATKGKSAKSGMAMVGGAAAGAAAGALLGPVAAAVGAVAGGIAGAKADDIAKALPAIPSVSGRRKSANLAPRKPSVSKKVNAKRPKAAKAKVRTAKK